MDAWLLEFIKENFLTIGLILGILKVIAVESPWAADDKILEILTKFTTRKL